ncbi:hypothetical protein HAX54_032866 [Datura stramonium]|uniref:Uncharacterized protein n=1 Tax=Datura stramonium TaxID=4076 RepID=A0ABS8RM72_DATST|nr:hypothetical protein [Datura stramonium]
MREKCDLCHSGDGRIGQEKKDAGRKFFCCEWHCKALFFMVRQSKLKLRNHRRTMVYVAPGSGKFSIGYGKLFPSSQGAGRREDIGPTMFLSDDAKVWWRTWLLKLMVWVPKLGPDVCQGVFVLDAECWQYGRGRQVALLRRRNEAVAEMEVGSENNQNLSWPKQQMDWQTSIWGRTPRKIRTRGPRMEAGSGRRKEEEPGCRAESDKVGKENLLMSGKFGGCFTCGGPHLRKDCPVLAKVNAMAAVEVDKKAEEKAEEHHGL